MREVSLTPSIVVSVMRLLLSDSEDETKLTCFMMSNIEP
jgi:hypothetical protein